MKSNTLVPLLDVVRILSQQHTAQQQRPPLHQPLKPRQTHLQLNAHCEAKENHEAQRRHIKDYLSEGNEKKNGQMERLLTPNKIRGVLATAKIKMRKFARYKCERIRQKE
jgi:hypothetical protein